ncbi:MAG: gamma-glutamyl-gamma-aminobutyrate hydrolase family protein [Candidatus Riflebacteria bacterium]|nr:gamma-glutamyl-gamma-aminobutyrate hydrolase family protein [Candidatus Riflebacteria bacterium]
MQPAKRPLIGIAYSDSSVRDNEMRIRTYVSRKYFHAVQKAGGDAILLPAPLLLPGCEAGEFYSRFVDRYLGLIDGLLLPGGEDVHPRFQGEDPTPALDLVNPFRDEFELKLAQKAHELQLPMLGICRGIQVMAIALGGKVHQDIAPLAGVQHSQKAPRWSVSHRVILEKSSRLASIQTSKDEIFTNSFHHQAVKDIPHGFMAAGRTSDGIIEAIESFSDHFCLGVQWHPEETYDFDEASQKIFMAFVNAAA